MTDRKLTRSGVLGITRHGQQYTDGTVYSPRLVVTSNGVEPANMVGTIPLPQAGNKRGEEFTGRITSSISVSD